MPFLNTAHHITLGPITLGHIYIGSYSTIIILVDEAKSPTYSHYLMCSPTFTTDITESLRYILIGNNPTTIPSTPSSPTSDAPSPANNELVELVPRSPQELYELVCLICELLPALPTTGVFAIDAQLKKGSTQTTQLGLWQWKDDKSNWHSYTWVDNRIVEAAYQGGEEEISLSTLGRNYIIDFSNMQQVFSRFCTAIFITIMH